YCASRMPRRIASASRKPRVVSRPTRATSPVRTALVVTVVPWTMTSTSARNASSMRPSPAASSARPVRKPSAESAGVDGVFAARGVEIVYGEADVVDALAAGEHGAEALHDGPGVLHQLEPGARHVEERDLHADVALPAVAHAHAEHPLPLAQALLEVVDHDADVEDAAEQRG